jgi:hypothetical protein
MQADSATMAQPASRTNRNILNIIELKIPNEGRDDTVTFEALQLL